MTSHTRRRGLWVLLIAAALVLVAVVNWALPWMRVNRGIFEYLQGNDARAQAILMSMRVEPPNFRPIHYLTSSLVRMGRYDEAQRRLRDCSRQFPHWLAPRFEEATLFLRMGEWDTSWPAMAWASEQSSDPNTLGLDRTEHELALAAKALGEGRPAEALALLGWRAGGGEDLVRHAGERDDLRALMAGMALLHLGEWRLAKEPLEASLQIFPKNPRAAVLLAMIRGAEGEWHRARHLVDVARFYDRERTNRILLEELRHQIDLTNQTAVDGASLAFLPRSDAVAWLADLLAGAGAWEELAALVRSQPAPERLVNPLIWQRLSVAEFFLDQPEESRASLRRALEINPNWPFDPDWVVAEHDSQPFRDESRWRAVALPASDELPAGSGRFGENLEMISIFSETAIDIPVEVDRAGRYRIDLAMGGRASGPIWPLVEVSVPPAPPRTLYLNFYRPRHYITTHLLQPGVNTLRVAFVNDLEHLTPGQDRIAVLHGVWVEREPLFPE